MTTEVDAIVEWLRACLNDHAYDLLKAREADARYRWGTHEIDKHPEILREELDDLRRSFPYRDIQAKGRIIDRIERYIRAVEPAQAETWILRELAAPYSDRDGYEERWKL